jgi:hypothetical protein
MGFEPVQGVPGAMNLIRAASGEITFSENSTTEHFGRLTLSGIFARVFNRREMSSAGLDALSLPAIWAAP